MQGTAFLLGFALAAGLVLAQNAPPAVRYVCGGVGEAEQQRMKAEAPGHDAMLTFAQSTGAYLADVDVRISTSRGAVILQARCEGPIMLVDLPGPGRYEVSASVNGQERRQTISAGGTPKNVVFTWPPS